MDVIRRVQDVYRRLQPSQGERCHGIVNCIGFSSDATQLAYMQNGDLRAYLEKNRPSHSLQLSWFRQMARILEYIHSHRVLVADIASRNFLLDSDLSLRLCDFSEASILPPNTDMASADDHGFSSRIDIGLLGAVMYEVVTGVKCGIDLFHDNLPTDGRAHWPERTCPARRMFGLARSSMPAGLTTEEFQMRCLLRALHSVELQN
jgi:serine/threonine protein kinase